MVVLKAAFYNKPISHFKHLQRTSFWENLQIFASVISESLLLKLAVTFPEMFVLKCVIYILNVLFINVLTDSFVLLTNKLFKMLEFNPLCYICENI